MSTMDKKKSNNKERFKANKKNIKVKPRFKKRPNKTQRDQKEIETNSQLCQNLQASDFNKFQQMPISSITKKGLKEAGFVTPTRIQKESLVVSLKGLDVLGAAKTGSGKTLAFLIPLLEKLFSLKWSQQDGIGALVITPTRELAMQIFEQLRKIGKYHDFSAGLVIGGKDLVYESKRMAKCNIVICTPGRLLQHMDENPQFDANSLQMLILDEADKCLEMGFSKQMDAIFSQLPKDEQRQTLLFSATQTRSVKDLARLSLTKPVLVSADEHASQATPDQLTERYMVCKPEEKLNLLWSFIKYHRKEKILVFVQCRQEAKFICESFRKLRAPTQMSAYYGTMKQKKRTEVYLDFCSKKSGVLVATDIAARGLDFPIVDWVIQFDCPEDWKSYKHRVGRTARNRAPGKALLFLLPTEEEPMIKQLKSNKLPILKEDLPKPHEIASIQKKLEAYLASDNSLKEHAVWACQSYVKSIGFMKDKTIFKADVIDSKALASSYGLPNFDSEVSYEKPEIESSSQKTSLEDENDDDDDLLTVKRINHKLVDNSDEEDLQPLESDTKKKPVTKVAAAKKVLKKKMKINSVVKFDEDDQEIPQDINSLKLSKAGKSYENEDDEAIASGIDFNKARAILKEEDVFDRAKEKARVKEMHKEQKRKIAENKQRQKNDLDNDSEDSEDGVNLDWLPDPDKVYDNKDEENPRKRKHSESSESGDDNEEESDEEYEGEANLEETEMLAAQLLGN